MADNPRTKPTDETDEDQQPEGRDEELSGREKIRDALLELYHEVEKGFQDQQERSYSQMDYWDIYNCRLGAKQFYNGNTKIFVPIVHNAINARKTRFTNQIFPQSGRYVECTTQDGSIPHAMIALAEHYVQKARLRTEVMPALMRNGDVEGQYNIYVGWRKRVRHVAWKVWKPLEVDRGVTIETPETIEDIEEETLTHGAPYVEVLADSDVLVIPQTADSIDSALEMGGSVTVIRRWSKAKIEQMIEDNEIVAEAGEKCLEQMRAKDVRGYPDKSKMMTDAAGIKGEGPKYLLAYETWTKLTIGDERWIVRCYFGSSDNILGCKRNPYWSDKVPVISSPVEKVQGSFKGRSKVEPVADLQYYANDVINEGADSSAFSMMPIIMTDPLKNPRIGSLQLSLGAIWQTSPQDTSFAQFPELWRQALELVRTTKDEIFQALSVNPAMITQPPGKKRNQAEMANEAMVEITTTADVVTVIEEAILSPMIGRFIELDHQYRDTDLSVRQYGELGSEASMTEVPPVQMNRRYYFRWYGVESARNAQAIQQQIAGMNVLMGIPPQQLRGYEFNAVPIITQLVENMFGPRIAPKVFVSPEMQMPVPVDQENMLLVNGFEIPTHNMDDDQQHIQSHTELMQMAKASENVGAGEVRKIQQHIFQHMQQAQRKQQAAQQAQMAQLPQQQGGTPGRPGGAGPGVAGTPRPGAQPQMPRTGQGPPGMIPQDQLRDPRVFPRRM